MSEVDEKVITITKRLRSGLVEFFRLYKDECKRVEIPYEEGVQAFVNQLLYHAAIHEVMRVEHHNKQIDIEAFQKRAGIFAIKARDDTEKAKGSVH